MALKICFNRATWMLPLAITSCLTSCSRRLWNALDLAPLTAWIQITHLLYTLDTKRTRSHDGSVQRTQPSTSGSVDPGAPNTLTMSVLGCNRVVHLRLSRPKEQRWKPRRRDSTSRPGDQVVFLLATRGITWHSHGIRPRSKYNAHGGY